jgi:hypothetical protein
MRIPIILALVAVVLSCCTASQAVNPPDRRTAARTIPAAILTIPPATRRTTSGSAAVAASSAAKAGGLACQGAADASTTVRELVTVHFEHDSNRQLPVRSHLCYGPDGEVRVLLAGGRLGKTASPL